ncbi:hypothetical protein IM774_00070 [Erysipelotrichaceae bacterium RD49]|nr:hypothetical protein [Erysipelotrichaceae bacterium RD49]
MKKNETFPWPMDDGAAMDFANGQLILAVKDEDWNENQLESAAKNPFNVLACETNGMIIFLMEGGPLDTCDFYFNIQECDEKDRLLAQKNLDVQAVLIDGNNVIKAVKSATLSAKTTEELHKLFEKQAKMEFMPGEYDVNLDGLMSAMEPPELARYGKVSFELH